MPLGLERRHNLGHLHFITFSCHNRLPHLDSSKPKEILEQIIERTRRSHNFLLYAYVVMPEHLHLLLSEPQNPLLLLRPPNPRLAGGPDLTRSNKSGAPYLDSEMWAFARTREPSSLSIETQLRPFFQSLIRSAAQHLCRSP